jgi:uncharacterized membrane protein YqjE
LTIASLLTILLSMFHLTDDIVYRISPGRFSNLPVVLVLVVWVYATLVLAERRSGYVIVLVLSLLASGLPVIHMMNPGGVTAGLKSGGAFFYAWTLLTVGVTAIFSVILSARGLWSLRRARRGSRAGAARGPVAADSGRRSANDEAHARG